MQRDGAPEVPIDVRGVFRFRVRDGLVAARADYWDGEVVAAQVAAVDGASESPGGEPSRSGTGGLTPPPPT